MMLSVQKIISSKPSACLVAFCWSAFLFLVVIPWPYQSRTAPIEPVAQSVQLIKTFSKPLAPNSKRSEAPNFNAAETPFVASAEPITHLAAEFNLPASSLLDAKIMPKLLSSQQLEVFEVGQLDRIPKLLYSPKLLLPKHLSKLGLHGSVKLKIRILTNGSVDVVRVLHAQDSRLIAPALEFAKQCIFEPPMRKSQRVEAFFILPIIY